jgi:hypothetical protein
MRLWFFLYFKSVLKINILFFIFCFKLRFFCVFRSFWCIDIKKKLKTLFLYISEQKILLIKNNRYHILKHSLKLKLRLMPHCCIAILHEHCDSIFLFFFFFFFLFFFFNSSNYGPSKSTKTHKNKWTEKLPRSVILLVSAFNE